MTTPDESSLPPHILNRYLMADDFTRSLMQLGYDLESITAIGLLMASRGIRTASGCGWLVNAVPTDERTVAYLTRTDVTQGYDAADHILQCDCTNAHHLGALFGRLGHFMESVFDRIRAAKAEALK